MLKKGGLIYMQRGLGYFLLIIVFIVGLSVGLYTGTNSIENRKLSQNNNGNVEPIQDVVIKKVQGKNEEENNSGEEKIVEVVRTEEKISPYAKLVIKKKFSKCNHTTVSIVDVPKELVNLPRKDLEEKYSGWEIEKFSSDEVILYREIAANCEDHFVLKEKDGNIAIYNETDEDEMNLIEILSVNLDLLSEEDKNNLQEGIKIYGKDELNSLIEDYTS